jgi:DNA-binding MarR family transcriptional regulator
MTPTAADDLAPDGREERPVSLGELERIAGFALRIAELTAFERFLALMGPGDVRVSEATVLYAVSRNPGIRQGVLADVLKIKWPNMTKVVRALEEKGLIERHIPRNNRRSVVLHLTDRGRDRAEAFAGEMLRSDRQALSMLDDREYAQLLALCGKIAGWPAPNTDRSKP